jgi:hypothetical protein
LLSGYLWRFVGESPPSAEAGCELFRGSGHHLIRRTTVAPILPKRRFAPRILQAAPKQVVSLVRWSLPLQDNY